MTRISPLLFILALGLASLSPCSPGWADESAALQDRARPADLIATPLPGSTAGAAPADTKGFDPPELGIRGGRVTTAAPRKPEPVKPAATGPVSWVTTITELVSSLRPRQEDLDNAIESPTGMYRNPRKARTNGKTLTQPAGTP